MAAWPVELQVFIVALAASLVVGVPVRIVGWRATANAVGFVWRLTRRRRLLILALALLGAAFGLWRFADLGALWSGLF